MSLKDMLQKGIVYGDFTLHGEEKSSWTSFLLRNQK